MFIPDPDFFSHPESSYNKEEGENNLLTKPFFDKFFKFNKMKNFFCFRIDSKDFFQLTKIFDRF
jgi:hypothetical protein